MTRTTLAPPRNGGGRESQFVNNFWGSGDYGYTTIQTRIKDSLRTMQELIDFYQEKIHVEKEYCKKLEKLSNKYPIGTHETGTLRKSLDKLNVENEHMIQNTYKFVKSIDEINLVKLKNFQGVYSKKVNKLQHHMNKVLMKKQDAWKHLEIVKNNYRQDCIKIKQFKLLQQTTWGKELEKHQRDYQKVNSSISTTRKNYQIALASYNEINDIYIKDWKISLNDYFKLELERIQTCKVNCFNYCNNIATLCVDNDQSVDLARTVFAQIQPPWDLQEFSNNYGTGDKIYQGCAFVEYINGEEEKPIEYLLSSVNNPDHVPILSRTYSTYSSASHGVVHTNANNNPNNHVTNTNNNPNTHVTKQLAPLAPLDIAKPKTPSPTRKQPPEIETKSNVHQDVFSLKDRETQDSDEEDFAHSNGSSNYSNPTTYSNYSTNSNNSEQRHWASPRRKEKQLQQVQEQITRRATNEFSNLMKKPIPNLSKPETSPTKVPVMKDFSIDFIAKALEDLNSGGNGDVNQFRRSVRSQAESKRESYQTEPTTPVRPQSDFVDDRHETATRYESINFNSPVKSLNFTSPEQLQSKPRPKSLVLESERSNIFGHSLSRKSTKSFLNLHAMINRTPANQKSFIGKARAKYSFTPQSDGELLFKKGWNMYIIYKQEDNWYVCELGNNCEDHEGLIGLVPGNYLIEGDDLF